MLNQTSIISSNSRVNESSEAIFNSKAVSAVDFSSNSQSITTAASSTIASVPSHKNETYSTSTMSPVSRIYNEGKTTFAVIQRPAIIIYNHKIYSSFAADRPINIPKDYQPKLGSKFNLLLYGTIYHVLGTDNIIAWTLYNTSVSDSHVLVLYYFVINDTFTLNNCSYYVKQSNNTDGKLTHCPEGDMPPSVVKEKIIGTINGNSLYSIKGFQPTQELVLHFKSGCEMLVLH